MKLQAPLKDYIWGGTKLKTDYGKKTDLEKVSESWELACHKDGMSIIENGPEAGRTLKSYLDEAGPAVLGEHAKKFPYFPLLIKLIDAKDNLSVQSIRTTITRCASRGSTARRRCGTSSTASRAPR